MITSTYLIKNLGLLWTFKESVAFQDLPGKHESSTHFSLYRWVDWILKRLSNLSTMRQDNWKTCAYDLILSPVSCMMWIKL